MKIAIVSPPWTALPPEDHTGIETTIYNLTEEYHKASENVILFAPEGTFSSAETIFYPGLPKISGLEKNKLRAYIKDILSKYAYLKALSLNADIIHDFTLSGEYDIPIPLIHTVYGPPKESTMQLCRKASEHPNNYLIAVSNSQRAEFSEINPDINFTDTIYKCIETRKIKWSEKKEDYFLFIGSQHQKKNLELAKRVADKAKKRLVDVIYGEKKEDNGDIKPWLRKESKSMDIRLNEDLPKNSRFDLYRNAKALLHVNRWEEPFAMEMLESLACGTPVIAIRRGAAAEIIEHGKTGFLVQTEKEMIEAVKKIDKIKPKDCRKSVEKKFSSSTIAKKHLKLYNSIPKV